MSEFFDRFALGDVRTDGTIPSIEPNMADVTLTFEDYSRFKYGDGRMSDVYGRAMAQQIVQEFGENTIGSEMYVTSSAYKIARPASASLVKPFVEEARTLTDAFDRPPKIIPIKVNRAHLTDGDYADMSLAERERCMRANGLSLPEGIELTGARVVALDDIRVTGSHEASIDATLRTSGAGHVTHAYILDVPAGKTDPQLESRINHSAVGSIEDIIALAALENFTPNARLAKRILSDSDEAIDAFTHAVPRSVTEKVIYDAHGDGLHEMERYAPGYAALCSAAMRLLHVSSK